MNDSSHLGDDVEAYALGILPPDARALVDAHVVRCDRCIVRLREAERTVATMLELDLPTYRDAIAPNGAPGWTTGLRRSGAIVAAACLVGFLSIRVAILEGDVRSDGALVRSMVASHFDHAAFRAPDGRELDAKVVYDRRGRWYEVIATDATWRVAIVAHGERSARPVDEALSIRGDAAVLRVANIATPDAFELRDANGRTIGRADVTLARPTAL